MRNGCLSTRKNEGGGEGSSLADTSSRGVFGTLRSLSRGVGGSLRKVLRKQSYLLLYFTRLNYFVLLSLYDKTFYGTYSDGAFFFSS